MNQENLSSSMKIEMYEARKKIIQEMNLSTSEYEQKIRELIEELEL